MGSQDRLGMSPLRALVAWVIVFLIGGMAGVAALLFCNYLLTFGGAEHANKHGISEVSATRIGGVAVVFYVCLHLAYQHQLGVLTPSSNGLVVLVFSAQFFLIGFFEDMRGVLGAKVRFALMLGIALLGLLISPSLILGPVDIAWVDWFLVSQISAFIFTAICLAFIPNAFNAADGANGLVSGVAVIVLAGLSEIAPSYLLPYLSACLVGCLVFLVFNLLSGRFFLGDGGAYFLGAFCGICMIIVSNTSVVSTWWLLSLVFYPVADLLWSMGRRVVARRSPFEADNSHLHNLIFTLLSKTRLTSYGANTVTGIGVAAVFSGTPLLLQQYGLLSVDSDKWIMVVILQWLMYVLSWRVIGVVISKDEKSRSISQV